MEAIYAKANIWKAIRAKCMDCSGNVFKEVEHCAVNNCPLYPYRFGKSEKVYKKKAQKA